MALGGSLVVRPPIPGLAAPAANGAIAGLVLAVTTAAVRAFTPPATAAWLWAGQLLVDRGRVRRLELAGSGDLVASVGEADRRIRFEEIGGIGSARTVVAGAPVRPVRRDAGRRSGLRNWGGSSGDPREER